MQRTPCLTTFGSALAAALMLFAVPAATAKKPGITPACFVPGGYATIQAAVDDPECLSIVVGPGNYYENVLVQGRDVDIRGAGPDKTIVNGSGKAAPVFSFNGTGLGSAPTNDATLEGMTITGANFPGPCPSQQPMCNRNGGGISSARFSLTVKDCVITGNTIYGNGGGLSAVFGPVTVLRSVITNNVALAYFPDRPVPAGTYYGGGGIRVTGCPTSLVVKHSVIAGNLSQRVGGGIMVYTPETCGAPPAPVPPGTLTLVNTLITGNRALNPQPAGGGVFDARTTFAAPGSEVTANAPDDIAQ